MAQSEFALTTGTPLRRHWLPSLQLEEVIKPVKEVPSTYIDDVIIYSGDWKRHLVDVERVIRCFGEAGLKIKRRKCEWGRKYMSYLGHQIGSGRFAVPEARVEHMANYGRPKTKKQLRTFLGAVGFYRKFVDGFAKTSSLVTPSTTLSAPHRVIWTREMDEAFKALRVSLCERVVLHVPLLSDVFVLYCDASGCGLGACLHVVRDGEELPVAFYSRQLRGAEVRYTVTELETLAIAQAVEHFNIIPAGCAVEAGEQDV